MALLENARPKGPIEDSGFFTLTGDVDIAEQDRLTQSAMISNGTDLENRIEDESPYSVYKTEFRYYYKNSLKKLATPEKIKGTEKIYTDVYEIYQEGKNGYFPKLAIPKDVFIEEHNIYIDKKFIQVDGIWVVDDQIHIAEYKTGASLDTEKSAATVEKLQRVQKVFKYYNPQIHIVLWNLEDINDNSIKSSEAKKHIITGRAFSEIVGLNFDEVQSRMKEDQEANLIFKLDEYERILRKKRSGIFV